MAVDLLAEAGGAPGSIALVSDERSWTYAELDASVTKRAAELHAEGIEAGGIVPVTMDATADSVVTLLALWRRGATPAPLNARLTPVERTNAEHSLAGEPSAAQAVLWTSGTEGTPRGVAVSFDNLAASTRAVADRLDLGADDVWLASLSPAHVGGLALISRSLLLGGRLVAIGTFDAGRCSAVIDGSAMPGGLEDPVSHVSLVPTQLLRVLDLRGDRPPPSTFRCALVGGAGAPTELVDRALGTGWPIALTYGLTEATSQVATAPPALTARKPGTVGPPLAGVEVRLDGDEVLVRGPTVATRYAGPHAGAVPDADGWLHTADLGRLDQDGDLWITGRRSDRIVTGGVTVDAVEVEEALRAFESVADACVVGVEDAEWGERIAAWIVPSEDAVDLDALRGFLRQRLSAAKLPRTLHVSAGLPRNANGKVNRSAVRDTIHSREESP